MGYQISYNNEKTQINRVNSKHFGSRIISIVLSCILIFGCLKLIGWDRLKHYLLPGDPAVTETAFNSMIESLQTGESVKDAVTAFCVEIIEHAK